MANHDPLYSCLQQQEIQGRWFFAKDINCDGVFTISDVALWLDWAFFLPGDGLLWVLMQMPELANFLELTPDAYSGWFSGIASAIGWLIALGVMGAISDS